MPYSLHGRVTRSIYEIESIGGHCSDFDWILERLRLGRDIPERFSDHALRGKLAGLRSVIIGHTVQGRTVVMVYQVVRHRVAVAMVDEHDKAYETMRIEKSARRRRLRRKAS